MKLKPIPKRMHNFVCSSQQRVCITRRKGQDIYTNDAIYRGVFSTQIVADEVCAICSAKDIVQLIFGKI